MARAIGSLGVDLGLTGFERYSFVERRGQGSYVAAYLGRATVRTAPHVQLVADLEQHGWLDSFLQFAHAEKTAARFRRLGRQLEDRLFALGRNEARIGDIEALLRLLGEIQSTLAVSPKARQTVGPLPPLSAEWLRHSLARPAARVAAALASVGVGPARTSVPMRAHLWPVYPTVRRFPRWKDDTPQDHTSNNPLFAVRCHVERNGVFSDWILRVQHRRLWLRDRLDELRPFGGHLGIGWADWLAFVRGDLDDQEIEALLRGAALLADESLKRLAKIMHSHTGSAPIPAAPGLLAFALIPTHILRSLRVLPDDASVRLPPQLPALLRAGHHQKAVDLAWRTLRGAGITVAFPRTRLPIAPSLDPRRLGAALLLPLHWDATNALLDTLVEDGHARHRRGQSAKPREAAHHVHT